MMLMHRRHRYGLIGLLALLMGLLPTSVLSSFFKPDCGMACCAEEAPKVSCCVGHAEEGIAPAPESSSCPCEIAPAPSGEHHGVVAAKTELPTSWSAVLVSMPSWDVIVRFAEVSTPATGLRGPPIAALRASPHTRAPPFSRVA